MKGGYVLRDLASAVSANHSWSTHNGLEMVEVETGFLGVNVVIRVKLPLSGLGFSQRRKKNAVRLA